jgi:hypothetical protein
MKQLARDPTDEEWASAAGVELSILRRRLALGRAARIKLIQVSYFSAIFSVSDGDFSFLLN